MGIMSAPIERDRFLPVLTDRISAYLAHGNYHAIIREYYSKGKAPPKDVADRCGELAFEREDYNTAMLMFTISLNAARLQDCMDPLVKLGRIDLVKLVDLTLQSIECH